MRLVAIAFLFMTLTGGCAAEDVSDPSNAAQPVAADQAAIDLGDPWPPGGGQCGDHVCQVGTYCCNASCGWCVPRGNLCPQVVCETALDDGQAEAPAAE